MLPLLTDRSGRPSWFSDQSERHRIGRGRDLASWHFHWTPFGCFREEVENVSAHQIEAGRSSCFSDRPENTNLVMGVELLLPVKFRWIMCSGFRGEVENVSANQMPGAILFSRSAQKHKLDRGHWEVASCQIRWILFSGFRGEKLTTTDGQRVITIVHEPSVQLHWKGTIQTFSRSIYASTGSQHKIMQHIKIPCLFPTKTSFRHPDTLPCFFSKIRCGKK